MTKYYNLTKLLATMLFKAPSPIIPDNAFPPASAPGMLLTRVRMLTAEKKINEAENLLFDSFNLKMPVYIAIALDFYAKLSELTEAELEAADFSVEEIGEGIKDMMDFYKIKLVKKPAPPQTGEAQTNQPASPNVLADKPEN